MSNNIYSAVYSGVPVYEMMCRGIAVMRRRADSYMNATQILKVAGIDKGKRTKILEREVLIGEHEKVQGGYGKYQGTWIPFDKSRELAERYSVAGFLAPMFDFDGQQNGEGSSEVVLTKEQHAAVERKKVLQSSPLASTSADAPARSPSARLQSKETPSATTKSPLEPKKTKRTAPAITQVTIQRGQAADPQDTSGERHRSALMAIFLNDDPNHIPELLKSQEIPQDFNTELVIDDQGHTALHWAAALAREQVVELLLKRGAHVLRTNYAGETALMRACMVVNNYEQKTFQHLLSSLERSLLVADNNDRTFLHHIALTSAIEGREEAASYYLHCTVKLLSERKNMQGLLDLQDINGNTALNIAARGGSQRLVEQLMEAGASTQLTNHLGIKPEDYDEEDIESEREAELHNFNRPSYDSGPHTPTRVSSPYNLNSVGRLKTPDIMREPSLENLRSPLVPSKRGREIVSAVQKIVDELDSEFSEELEAKQHEINQIQQSLESTATELKESRARLQQYKLERQRLAEAQRALTNLTEAVDAEKESTGLQNISELKDEDIDQELDVIAHTPSFDPSKPESAEAMNGKADSKDLELSIRKLRARITIYQKNENDLVAELEELQKQSGDKESQCKKLIAACCGVPIEKVDSLLHPLIQAIESDPPDLDLSRVAGFMAKIQNHDDKGDLVLKGSQSADNMNEDSD
ncbi:hypothetical protein K450DRAFT_249315 [Umbelopsis ramanniana AG]|uniref:HTH APSES-type domain-containing protein n=1 Tax=Umbelopsis ramanniana AG TaxID=1314678 RepID=A0AAD5E987_UMBRA|nr:uncharacterized protein K450DRAFT_249315 [Umbelopsis ramanniana AG]KAI8577975.1 hypothetical protein K450DRAFT_249315 [Umbelopsis ramanniana AG]